MAKLYEYPQRELDLDVASRYKQAWLDSRTERDRALLQLVGFLLAGTLAVLSQEQTKVVGNRQVWVGVLSLLGIAAAALVRILRRDSDLLAALSHAHKIEMFSRADVEPESGPVEPNPGEASEAIETDLACLDSLAQAMVAFAGLVAVGNLAYAFFG